MSSLLCTAPRKTPRTRPQCPASHTRWPAFLFWRLFLRLALFDVSGVLEAPEMCPRCLRCFVFRSVWHWSALSWVSTCGSGVFRVVVASPSLPLRSSSDVGQVLVVGLVVWRACSCLRCLFVFFLYFCCPRYVLGLAIDRQLDPGYHCFVVGLRCRRVCPTVLWFMCAESSNVFGVSVAVVTVFVKIFLRLVRCCSSEYTCCTCSCPHPECGT